MVQDRPVEPIFATTTPIQYRDEDGGGTGFFYTHGDSTYLITNRHVLDPEEEDVNPSEIRIWLRDFNNIGNARSYDIEVSHDDKLDWLAYGEVDLAAIPLSMRLSTLQELSEEEHKTGSLAFTEHHIVPENLGIDQRVTIVGYPGDFMDYTTYFPVKRSALIASPYGVQFNGNPCFVTDARMHPGTSGSPVIFEPGSLRSVNGDIPEEKSGLSYYLLGIHSATHLGGDITDYQSDTSEEPPTPTKYELNTAWYPDLISGMINAFESDRS